MNTARYGITAGILGITAFMWVGTAPSTVDARPKYREVFAAQYPALAEQVNKVKCGVCHPPAAAEKKKARNNYGMALGKALGKKNESDKDEILKVLTKIESEKSATEGKTFGDLIKAGTLPGKNE